MYICLFLFMYIVIFSYIIVFYIFTFFILIFLWFVWMIMYYCTCDSMSVSDCMLTYGVYLSLYIVLLTVVGASWEAKDAYSMASIWFHWLEYTE